MADPLGSQGSGEGAQLAEQRAELTSRNSRGHPCAMVAPSVNHASGLHPAAHCCMAICLVTQPLCACFLICKAGEITVLSTKLT